MSDSKTFNDLYLDNKDFDYRTKEFTVTKEEWEQESEGFKEQYNLYSRGNRKLGAGDLWGAEACFSEAIECYTEEERENLLNYGPDCLDNYTERHKKLISAVKYQEALLLKFNCEPTKQLNRKVDRLLKDSALAGNTKAILFYYNFGDNQQLGENLFRGLELEFKERESRQKLNEEHRHLVSQQNNLDGFKAELNSKTQKTSRERK